MGFWVCGSGGVFESCTFYLHDGRANRCCRVLPRLRSLSPKAEVSEMQWLAKKALLCPFRRTRRLQPMQQPLQLGSYPIPDTFESGEYLTTFYALDSTVAHDAVHRA